MIDVLIPLKTKNQAQYDLFKDCFNSYYQCLKDLDVRYVICDESNEDYYKQNNEFLAKFNIKMEYVQNSGPTFYDTITTLIDNLKSKYFLFVIDDVEMYDKRNILLPSVQALEADEKLIQIMLGPNEIVNNKNQIHIEHSQNKAMLGTIEFKGIKINTDTIWTTKIDNRTLLSHERYIFAYWNAIMRNDAFKEYHPLVKINTGSSRTFHGYAENASFCVPDWLLTKEYKTGWVNFENFLYPHYRAGHGITKEVFFNMIRKD